MPRAWQDSRAVGVPKGHGEPGNRPLTVEAACVRIGFSYLARLLNERVLQWAPAEALGARRSDAFHR
eukprot:15477230-Alexandrium_andersonii.AAC.1